MNGAIQPASPDLDSATRRPSSYLGYVGGGCGPGDALVQGLDEAGGLSTELCDPEIVIRNWDSSPVRGPYHGYDGLRQWWADFADVIEDAHLELKEAIDLGDGRVVTTQHLVGRFRLTGIEVNGPFGSILAVSEGRIVSATGYATPGQAKKAAGMPRPGSTAEARRYAPRP